jgi:hypothetical protein
MNGNAAPRRRFLAELYSSSRHVDDDTRRIRAAAAALADGGLAVGHLQAVFVPDEEMCLHLFEAPDEAAVRRVLSAAGLDAERISPAVGPLVESPSLRS